MPFMILIGHGCPCPWGSLPATHRILRESTDLAWVRGVHVCKFVRCGVRWCSVLWCRVVSFSIVPRLLYFSHDGVYEGRCGSSGELMRVCCTHPGSGTALATSESRFSRSQHYFKRWSELELTLSCPWSCPSLSVSNHLVLSPPLFLRLFFFMFLITEGEPVDP